MDKGKNAFRPTTVSEIAKFGTYPKAMEVMQISEAKIVGIANYALKILEATKERKDETKPLHWQHTILEGSDTIKLLFRCRKPDEVIEGEMTSGEVSATRYLLNKNVFGRSVLEIHTGDPHVDGSLSEILLRAELCEGKMYIDHMDLDAFMKRQDSLLCFLARSADRTGSVSQQQIWLPPKSEIPTVIRLRRDAPPGSRRY